MRDGDKITYEDIKSVRPGYGMPPKYLDSLIGLELKCPIKKIVQFCGNILIKCISRDKSVQNNFYAQIIS